MARSDLLVNLVRAGARGDPGTFRRTVEAIVAEERAKQHHVLADTLTDLINNGERRAVPVTANGARIESLFFELTPRRSARLARSLLRSTRAANCFVHWVLSPVTEFFLRGRRATAKRPWLRHSRMP